MVIEMNKLEQLINEFCPEGVEYKALGELGEFYSGLNGKSKDDFNNGNAKFITYMNVFSNPSLKIDIDDKVKIEKNENQNTIQYGDVIFTGSSETPEECGMSSVLTSTIDEKLYLNSFCFGFRFYDEKLMLPEFSKYVFRSSEIRKQIKRTASGVTRFNISKKKMEKVTIPLPPILVQEEIVRILDKFTELAAELATELAARKQQYEYYKSSLLTFGNEIEWKSLGDVCIVQAGGTPSKNERLYWENGNIKWLSSTVCKNQKNVDEITNYITEQGLLKSSARMMKANTTLVALVGATIGKHFKNYHIFGFTGTPIFAINSNSSNASNMRTTAQVFGGEPDENGNKVRPLHTYTIVDAIHDGNVLPFRIDYINTIKNPERLYDKQVKAIDRENALLDSKRVSEITQYILEHFEQKTYRNQSRSYYDHKVITNVEKMAKSKNNTVSEQKTTAKVNGFNSIFAVASIPAAIAYYNEFKRQMEKTGHKLNIATIFSFNPNEEDPDDILQDENFDTNSLDQTSRDFLDSAIDDYNRMFNVSYDTSADKFPNYYKDVSLRMKNREIDLLIVVNMFLTGFDATTLNTLWVDKNLKDHGLIQAFSRTNRILNSVKTFGNIVCFRNLETATNNALALFGDKKARGMVILKAYNEYMNGYEDEHGKHIEGYNELVARLVNEFPISSQIIGEDNEKEFIKLFGRILKLRNILRCFDDFESDSSVSVRDLQDYQSIYIDLYQEYAKKSDIEKERINDDIVFEIELIKQVDVNIDYILMLVTKYHESNCEDKTILANINKSIDASVELRSKKALIEGFVAQMTVKTDVEKDWQDFVKKQKEQDLETIIRDEKLKHDEAQKFIENSFRDGGIKTTGTDIDKILPPISRFSGGSNRALKKQTVIDKLKVFFEKYFGVI